MIYVITIGKNKTDKIINQEGITGLLDLYYDKHFLNRHILHITKPTIHTLKYQFSNQ
ncbi:hypothetical protein JCM9140_2340 [Halalkalibacter wakoensis JCM 9140]|uniref:Uncharacterized protein n=1 Tax=Halalkalibacter wakoensis JCM 9140 TaxID=1236970 RepID=W4Q2H9_9BACI|nr:hypothetical protein JCM9140_2340 [Halalkalibacter wakoensis JCM 9140]